MKRLSVLIKPVSSSCNMRCAYCFYADESSRRITPSYGRMDAETLHGVLEHLFAGMTRGDQATILLQGGEPTLAGLDFCQALTDGCQAYAPPGVQVHYALQTNGLLLDDAWCAFLRRQGFLVGLSLDGPVGVHDALRRDLQGKGTYERVMQAKKRMDRHGVTYNILLVLTSALARRPYALWNFLMKNQLRYVQLIPCLGPLEGGLPAHALTPRDYAAFYCALFDLWYDAYASGCYVSVKLFDDYIRLLAYGECNACGLLGVCSPQLVVEADGSVYPCDFYALDAYRMGSLARQPLSELLQAPAMQGFLNRETAENPLCQGCPFSRICGGGCPRMRREAYSAGPDGVCGHGAFLAHALPRMMRIAQELPPAEHVSQP